jgi:hypothetical protein
MFVKLTHEKGFPVFVNVGQAVVLEPAGKGTRVIFDWYFHEGREKELRVMVTEPPDQVVALFNAEYAATMRGQARPEGDSPSEGGQVGVSG